MEKNRCAKFRLAARIEPAPFYAEALAAWSNPACRRRLFFGVLRETEAIFVRLTPGSSHEPELKEKQLIHAYYSMHDDTVVDAPEAERFPSLLAWLRLFAQRRRAFLGRVIVTRMPPGATSYVHVDLGAYYAPRDRYLLVLSGEANLYVENRWYRWRAGEVGWFDNKSWHGGYNPGPRERVAVLFDLLPEERAAEARELGRRHPIAIYGTDPYRGAEHIVSKMGARPPWPPMSSSIASTS
jgi:quercetin dioxygenase-like cupin family protein